MPTDFPVRQETLSMKHLLSFKNWSAEDLLSTIELASALKAEPHEYHSCMKYKTLAMIFQKTSTRTRTSFAAAMHQLGGSIVEVDWQKSNFTMSSVADETRCLDRYVDIIMARLLRYQDIDEMARVSRVPVMNGCCNRYHPCQILADLLTIREKFQRFEGVVLAYLGALNNVANSLLDGCIKLGMEVILVTPDQPETTIDPDILGNARQSGRYHLTSDVKAGVQKAAVVYTDTWVDMEVFNDPSYQREKEQRIRLFQPYQLNMELLRQSRALIMHCLPAHRGYEITTEALESERSIVFDQAENRLHAQKAAILRCLEG
jgi:ornithine carbamoyltransferase